MSEGSSYDHIDDGLSDAVDEIIGSNKPSYGVDGPPPDAPEQLPNGVTMCTPGKRLLAWFLELLLFIVTLGLGWILWATSTGDAGQTPAKRVLGMRVILDDHSQPARLPRMFWLRGLVGDLVAAVLIPVTLTVILFMPFWDPRNQNFWDKLSKTVVVNDPDNAWNKTPDFFGD